MSAVLEFRRTLEYGTQRTQYPFIKEYTLNHNSKAPITSGIFLNSGVLGSLGKGYKEALLLLVQTSLLHPEQDVHRYSVVELISWFSTWRRSDALPMGP